MSHPTARVEQGVLTLVGVDGASTISVGSPAWYDWLETAATFMFTGEQGAYTARREQSSSGRGAGYWRAYYHSAGTRRRAYLGRSAELSLERLETVAAALASAAASRSAPTLPPAAAPEALHMGAAHPAGIVAAPLLATKLFVPRARPDVVARPRLLARLDAGLHGNLTLVCAPAGFGKTTLLIDWLRLIGRPAAWLALDHGDNDPVVFLRYLVAALQTLAPQVGVALPSLLQSPTHPLETLLTALLNDLTELPAGSVLVLDDYHAIEVPAIHQALAFLTERLPATLHLVLATREDPPLPLARLRARGQISEVRAEQLRFAPAEARAFLTEVMGLSLSSADAAALESRTEGWVAGLQLAALALRDTDDQRGFIAAFTGSNRFIVDYLADEVLSKQPAHIQTFLLQTSILDRMCAALCDAVLGHANVGRRSSGAEIADADASSQRVLEQLERTNLFVIPLDAERRWYRYHHLFAEVLRERLRRGAAPDAVAALHLQASAWYAQGSLAPEAIQHALAAGAPDVAGQLIEAHGQQLIATGEIASLIRWLRLLPETTLREQPRLLVLLCWLLPNTGALDDVARYRADAEALLAGTIDTTLRGELLAIQLQPLVFQDRNDEVIAIGRQVLDYLPSTHFFHSVSGVVTGLALLRQSRLAEAEHVLSQAVAGARARQSPYFIVSGLSRMALLAIERGQIARAEQLLSEALDACRSSPSTMSPIAGMALVVLGSVRRLQGRWAEAIDTLQHGLVLCGQLNAAPFFFLDGHTCLADLYARQGEYDAAFEQLALAEERVRRFGNPVFTDTTAAHRASIWRTLSDPRFAGWFAEQVQRPHTTLTAARDHEYVTLVRGLIDADQLTAALGWINRLEAFAQQTGRQRSAVDVLVLQALALDRQGDARAAHTSLARALTLAAAMGYVSAFLEDDPRMPALLGRHTSDIAVRAHIGRIMEAAASAPTQSGESSTESPALRADAAGVIEPLTARELEILRLIADGASNGDIARRLIISIGTVKKHTSNILGKLQVQSRTQAIARARTLNLL